MNYELALKRLNALQSNHQLIKELHANWQVFKSQRDAQLVPEMKEYVRRIGYNYPDFDAMNVVHVTGTKGKGSTCAFVDSILRQYNLRTGLYTSPHLITVRERIRVNGRPLSEQQFTKYFFDVYNKLETSESSAERFPQLQNGVKPMYFRFLTLVSLHAFMREKIDTAIYEVGIGGQFDSTNIFNAPKVCGIASLGLDHTQILGTTIEEIAYNKAGIFKPGVPAYTVRQPNAALNVLESRAKELKCSKFEVVDIHPQLEQIQLGLKGEFQKSNAALAIALATERLGVKIGKTLPLQFIKGLEQASWPGRCQAVQTKEATYFVDGAHTFESLDVAADWFASVYNPQKPVTLVFNQQKRDNVDDLLVALHTRLQSHQIKIDKAIFTTNKTSTDGFTADMLSLNVDQTMVDQLVIQQQLAKVWHRISPETEVKVCSNLPEVIAEAKGQVFATGSLLMVGALLSVLE